MELQRPLILDGATGTQLQKNGYSGEICAEQWVLEHSDILQTIQKAYQAAGSHIVYAPTFGANRVKLEKNGIVGKVEEYNKKLVDISRAAVGTATIVAGDLAPTVRYGKRKP